MNPLIHAGGYTSQESPQGLRGIRVFGLDTGSCILSPLAPGGTAFPDAPDASFLALHPSGRFLYAVQESDSFEGKPEGAVSAYRVDRESGALALINRVGSGGAHPCHVSVTPGGNAVLVANYTGGSVAAFPLGPDGSLGAGTVRKHEGSGPDKDRQGNPHAHCVLPDPSGTWALSADLGADRIFAYALGRDGMGQGGDALRPAGSFPLPPGRGPRHLAFHASGRVLYCVGELEPVLSVFEFDPVTAKIRILSEHSLVPPGAGGRIYPSEVKAHPSGRFLHVALRGAGEGAWDGFAAFALDPAGKPSPSGWFPAGGSFPRHFSYAGGGSHLVAALQKADGLAAFRIDPDRGSLHPVGAPVPMPSPACVIAFS